MIAEATIEKGVPMTITAMFGSSAKANAVSQVLAEGMTGQNLAVAIDKHRGVLTEADKQVLMTLTPIELSTLQSINAKLAPLGISALY